MNILGIDTVQGISGVSLYKDNQYKASLGVYEKNKTASMLIPYIDYILKESNLAINDIDLIAVCSGPGSYTSLRIGYSTVKTLAIVNKIKLVEVSKLRVMAEVPYMYSKNNDNIISMLPTNYKKLYTATYTIKNNTLIEIKEPAVRDIEVIKPNTDNAVIIGKLRAYKKADDFSEITNFNNYIEYSENGITASLTAKIGGDMYKSNLETDPYKAEPLYLSSPF